MLNSVLQSLAHINNSYLNVALIQSEDSSVSIVNRLSAGLFGVQTPEQGRGLTLLRRL